ncbi:hypothetical protein QYE76_018923 [Lolium multiflorum]|uniref:GPI-anchored protein LLG1-like domain-containing protein n=1 Tax=Lolium multiflorum TaxID=4521 RepID=A0AAD8VB64_LOLMU|nr:hypothetical protein QYE76_018923 [Lolium multiflorum]
MGSSAAAVLLCVALSVVAAASAEPQPRFITMEALKATEPSSSRKLMVGFPEGFCPVQFDEKKQITKIANKCRGQEVPLPSCCEAFRSVACPYSALLDDVTNGCSVDLLMKIHDFCRMPAGYFAMCGDSTVGLSCPVS